MMNFAIRYSGLMYLIDNYKIYSIKVLNNDFLASIALSLSSLSGLIGKAMAS